MHFGSKLFRWCLAGVLVFAPLASADEVSLPGVAPADYDIVLSKSFMSAHPDMLNRLRGLGALDRGQGPEAAEHFRTAARYADKMSQAFLAQMLWEGRGIPRDRAMAYAWMDLAAERGTPLLLVERERYWEALDASERERAVRDGKALYAEYADDVAQPRLETLMRLALKDQLGSRTGNRSYTLDLCVGHWWISDRQLICNLRVPSYSYYRDQFWKPANYWQWQEAQINAPKGDVHLGAPETLKKDGP